MSNYEKFKDFRTTLEQVAKHPNRNYFIYKSIILSNLYGVDIMEEATEICKLRLFLKLVSQVEVNPTKKNMGLEPLPDIDFNIRAGNTLVGFATLEEVRRAITQDQVKSKRSAVVSEEAAQFKLEFGDDLSRINEAAEIADRAYQMFRQMQTQEGMNGKAFADAKKKVRQRLGTLNEELNIYLAKEYSVSKNTEEYNEWHKSHQPFHWFTEFNGIYNKGGFDAIIGNPPYIEIKQVNDYKSLNYKCEKSGNLYALVLERCFSLSSESGRQGYIVPVSSVSTDRYASLQRLLATRELTFSAFDDRPSRLFDGLEHIRLTIHLIGKPVFSPTMNSTKYNKWSTVERNMLFPCLRYSESQSILLDSTLPKLSSEIELSIIKKLESQGRIISNFYRNNSRQEIFYSRKVGYFLQILDFEPRVLNGKGKLRPPSEFKTLKFDNKEKAKIALCCFNSSLFYWFITVFSDCRHVNKREVDAFPVDLEKIEKSPRIQELMDLAQELMADLQNKSEHRVMKFSHDTLTVQCIMPKQSKPIIDKIDGVLSHHYGFTDEELDFIINYDIKYRMGLDTLDGSDD